MMKAAKLFIALLLTALIIPALAEARATIDHPIVKLRALDKITARTVTFDVQVGNTVKFGDIYIKVQACRKAPELEKPESASFLQVWEIDQAEESSWIFSGWMFASSPGLSSMDHPIYDVWVLDCLADETAIEDNPEEENDIREGEGEVEGEPENQPEVDIDEG